MTIRAIGNVLLSVTVLSCGSAVREAAAQPPTWRELGPTAIGGRVSALAVDPADSNHLVVGTPAGGLWESVDGGLTWTGLTLWLATVPISAVAIGTDSPKHMVAGTGSLSDAGAVSGGIGALHSPDRGATWKLQTDRSNGAFIAAMLIWPTDSQRVLVGTDLGLQLSRDGGATFLTVREGEAVSTLVRDPLNADVVFASTRAGLLRSADRGETWASVSKWPLLPTDTYGAGTTALALSGQIPGLLYASVQVLGTFNQTSRALLLRSNDGGRSFTHVPPPASFCSAPSSCGFAHALAIDPLDDRRLLLGGEQLSVSLDGAATWATVSGDVSGTHQIVVTGRVALAAGKSGVSVLTDDWRTATARNNGLAVVGVVSLDVSNEPLPGVLISTADSGTILSTGPVPTWNVVFGSRNPTGTARFDPFTSSRLFAAKPNGLLFRSQNSGATFESIQNGLDLSQAAAAVAPLEPSTLVPGTLFTGRLQTFKSVDGGDAWSPFRPAGFPAVSRIAASPIVDGRLYFATEASGHLYKADGDHTNRLTVSADPNLQIRSIFLDPAAQNRLYVGMTDTGQQLGRIFKSADFGEVWTEITPSGLSPVNAIVKDRFGALYAGTSDGVWRSANDGFSWIPFRHGLFAGGVNALQLGGGTLYAGTSGRGVFATPEQQLFSLESVPSGVQFLVDGEVVTAPYVVHWQPGTSHSIVPILQQSAGTRESFVAWSDGNTQSRTFIAQDANAWMIAAISRAFRLQASTVGAGTVSFFPGSADNFYPDRSFVSVVPVPSPDQRFKEFGGDISGGDGFMGYAVMDRPRNVSVTFEPLRTTIKSDPPGIPLTVDGINISATTTYQWPSGSLHTVSAPDAVATDATSPRITVFDQWTDLRGREHAISISRDTFVTDLTARFISTVRSATLVTGGAQTLQTPGTDIAPRMAALTVSTAPAAAAPLALQFVRGNVNSTLTSELAFAPSDPRTWTNIYVEDDAEGVRGQTRLALYNPGPNPASVGVLLRDSSGIALAAAPLAFTIPPATQVVSMLSDILELPKSFSALLTIISDEPLVTSVHSMRTNVRSATTLLDPVLVAPFSPGDRGVPIDARVQTVMLTPDTAHRLVFINTGFSRLSGTMAFRDESGAALAVPLPAGAASTVAYDLPPGGFLRLAFPTPAGGVAVTASVIVTPTGGPAPVVQLVEERTFKAGGDVIVLPRTLPPSSPATGFKIPVDAARRQTGALLTNTISIPAAVTITLIDMNGVVTDQTRITLEAFHQMDLSTASVFNLPAAFRGMMVVNLSIPVHGVGYSRVTNSRGEDIVAGFPLMATAPLGTITFPLAIDGDSWQSEWWLSNNTLDSQQVGFSFNGTTKTYFPIQ